MNASSHLDDHTSTPVSNHVLVVDDDDLVRDMVAHSLRRAGYRVTVAWDGRGAIAALSAQTPDLILTDLFMPNCDGIELLRSGDLDRVRVPVITMSGGYAGIDMLGASRALGATATIAKPFMPRELLALVRDTLANAGEPGDRPGTLADETLADETLADETLADGTRADDGPGSPPTGAPAQASR